MGASSPFDFSQNVAYSGSIFQTSVIVITRDREFAYYIRHVDCVEVFIYNEYTYIVSADLCGWRDLFINSNYNASLAVKDALDEIFQVLKKGNEIFRLEKVEGLWKLK